MMYAAAAVASPLIGTTIYHVSPTALWLGCGGVGLVAPPRSPCGRAAQASASATMENRSVADSNAAASSSTENLPCAARVVSSASSSSLAVTS